MVLSSEANKSKGHLVCGLHGVSNEKNGHSELGGVSPDELGKVQRWKWGGGGGHKNFKKVLKNGHTCL